MTNPINPSGIQTAQSTAPHGRSDSGQMYLNDLMTAPPGNWQYIEPRTGWHGTGTTFNDLVGKVSRHRANMRFEIVTKSFESLAAEIQDAICRKMTDKNRARLCESRQPPGPRPGDMFASIIHKITGQNALTCGRCAARVRQMNAWGWVGCFQHRHEVLAWLSAEAQGRGHVVSRSAMKSLFRAAWRELRGHKDT